MTTRKNKFNKKQKDTLKRMKQQRQVDSNNLREVIIGKLEWAKAEKAKGEKAIRQIQFQVTKLEGIIMFINDILLPPMKIKKEKKNGKKH